MLFSIVVPVYKVEDYLVQCVESVLSQSFKDFELILVDDGSPDRCGEMCDNFAKQDARITVVHKANGGSSDARNAGMSIAKGNYLVFLDSDDWWQESALERSAEILRTHGYPDVLAGRAVVYSSGCASEFINDWAYRDMPEQMSTNQEYFLFLTKKFNCVPWRYFIKRDLLIGCGLLFEKGFLNEDELWTPILLTKAKSFCFNNIPFYVYRIDNPNRVSISKSKRNVVDLIKISDRLYLESESDALRKEQRNFLKIRVAKTMINALVQYAFLDGQPNDREIFTQIKLHRKNIISKASFKNVLIYLSLCVLGIKFTAKILKKYFMMKNRKNER